MAFCVVVMNKYLRLFIGLSTLGLLIFFGASSADYFHVLEEMAITVLLGAYLVATVDRFLMAWKWNYLLRVLTKPLEFIIAMQIYCSSQLLGFFLPSTLGADAIRIVCTSAENRQATEVTASVIIERVFGVLASLVVCFFSMMAAGFHLRQDVSFLTALTVVCCLTVMCVGILSVSMNQRLYSLLHEQILPRFRMKKILGHLRRLHDSSLIFARTPKVLIVFFGLTIVENLVGGLFTFFLLYGLGAEVSFAYVVAAFNLAAFLGRLPISFSGLGIFEAGFVYLLSLEGISIEISMLAALLSRVIQIGVWVPWWAMYMMRKPTVNLIHNPNKISTSGVQS